MANKIIALLLTILLVVILSSGCRSTQTLPVLTTTLPAVSEGINIGNLASDFQLQTLDGKTVKLSDLRGKPVLLNFWATWCPFCQAERPVIQQIHNEWQDKGLVVLTVDIINSRPNETPSNLADFMKRNNYSFPVLLDID